METILTSDKVKLNIIWNFIVGDKENKLPLHRDFLILEILGNTIRIENAWDLLYTYSVTDIEHVNGKYYDYIFKKIDENAITMFNRQRCIVINRVIENYTICAIWNIDKDYVDFLCKFVDENNIPVLMTSDTIIERYGIDVLVS